MLPPAAARTCGSQSPTIPEPHSKYKPGAAFVRWHERRQTGKMDGTTAPPSDMAGGVLRRLHGSQHTLPRSNTTAWGGCEDTELLRVTRARRRLGFFLLATGAALPCRAQLQEAALDITKIANARNVSQACRIVLLNMLRLSSLDRSPSKAHWRSSQFWERCQLCGIADHAAAGLLWLGASTACAARAQRRKAAVQDEQRTSGCGISRLPGAPLQQGPCRQPPPLPRPPLHTPALLPCAAAGLHRGAALAHQDCGHGKQWEGPAGPGVLLGSAVLRVTACCRLCS